MLLLACKVPMDASRGCSRKSHHLNLKTFQNPLQTLQLCPKLIRLRLFIVSSSTCLRKRFSSFIVNKSAALRYLQAFNDHPPATFVLDCIICSALEFSWLSTFLISIPDDIYCVCFRSRTASNTGCIASLCIGTFLTTPRSFIGIAYT